MKIHLIYPHNDRISTPDVIGRKLEEFLSKKYEVILYDWDEKTTITPGNNDALVGHPNPIQDTVFRNSVKKSGWRRKLLLCPFVPDARQVSFIDEIIPYCDKYLTITGEYWFAQIKDSPFAHWLPKMVHMDLAVEKGYFPFIKKTFNPPGKRKFLYIGSLVWFKNVSYLSQLAAALPDIEFSWIGNGYGIKNLKSLGYQDFKSPDALRLIEEHDFMITVGVSDANPTTILESMAWGLIPVCTRESGYFSFDSIKNIPLNDVLSATRILENLNHMPVAELKKIQELNIGLIDTRFNWKRFSEQVAIEIENTDSPSLGAESIVRKNYFRQRAFIAKQQTRFVSKIYNPIKSFLNSWK